MGSPALLLVLLTLAGCGGGGGSAAPVSKATTTTPATTTTTAAAGPKKAVTITVTSIVSGRKTNDTPPTGASSGDKIHFTDRLVNKARQFGKGANEQVGTDKGTLTVTGAHTARLDGEAVLPGGKIRFAGEMTPVANNSVTVPIVGGTGKYENASGTLLVGAGVNRALNTFTIVIGGAPGPVA